MREQVEEPIFKRPFDVMLSGIGLFLSLPLWALIAAAIVMEDGRPVFFTQERIGRHGRMFRTVKFRSMRSSGHDVERQAQRGDPRVTSVGRLLRKTALDEAPQLLNIFVGDMSFVGPRAQPERERVSVRGVEEEIHIRQVPGYELRKIVRPGLTGIAQLYARRDVSHRDKFRYDLIYVRRLAMNGARVTGPRRFFRSASLLWFDLRLIAGSIWTTVRAKWEV